MNHAQHSHQRNTSSHSSNERPTQQIFHLYFQLIVHVWQTIFFHSFRSFVWSVACSLADVNLSFVHFVILWHMMLRWIFLKYAFVFREERGRNIKCLNTIFSSFCCSLCLSPDVTFHFELVIYSNITTAHRDDAIPLMDHVWWLPYKLQKHKLSIPFTGLSPDVIARCTMVLFFNLFWNDDIIIYTITFSMFISAHDGQCWQWLCWIFFLSLGEKKMGKNHIELYTWRS